MQTRAVNDEKFITKKSFGEKSKLNAHRTHTERTQNAHKTHTKSQNKNFDITTTSNQSAAGILVLSANHSIIASNAQMIIVVYPNE